MLIFWHNIGLPEEQVNPEDDIMLTFMQDERGNPLFLDINDDIFKEGESRI